MINQTTTGRPGGEAMRAAIRRSMAMLTARNGCPPTVRELGEHLGGKSTGHLSHHLRAMIASGEVEHRPRMARGLRLVVPGEPICAGCAMLRTELALRDEEIARLRAQLGGMHAAFYEGLEATG